MANLCTYCSRFTKNPPNQATAELHPCPYAEEINDDHEDKCDCCDDCAAECAADI